jgi:hypothetical protein
MPRLASPDYDQIVAPMGGAGPLIPMLVSLGLSGLAVLVAAGAPAHDVLLFGRYALLLGGAALAILPPHVLLPDSGLRPLQLANPPPHVILQRNLRRWSRTVGTIVPPLIILATMAGGSALEISIRLLHYVAFTAAVGLFAFRHYMRIGEVVQRWQEGDAGKRYRAAQEHLPSGTTLGVPPGAVPLITATGKVFIITAILLALSVYAGALVHWMLSALVPGAFLGYLAIRLRREAPAFDAHYYRTNGLYDEVFRQGGALPAGRDPLPYEAVYWVPARLRMHVWAGLRQLDRRLPLGRLMILGHLGLWVLVFRGADTAMILAYLGFFVVAARAVVLLTAKRSGSPPAFHLWMLPVRDWTLVRAGMNARWTLLMAISLGLLTLLSPRLTVSFTIGWILVDLIACFAFALFATLKNERSYQERYA